MFSPVHTKSMSQTPQEHVSSSVETNSQLQKTDEVGKSTLESVAKENERASGLKLKDNMVVKFLKGCWNKIGDVASAVFNFITWSFRTVYHFFSPKKPETPQ